MTLPHKEKFTFHETSFQHKTTFHQTYNELLFLKKKKKPKKTLSFTWTLFFNLELPLFNMKPTVSTAGGGGKQV